ncbi:MAG: hypothetical protein AAF806_04910 [Bacteroidota bacterium]
MKIYSFLIFTVLLLASCGEETQTSTQSNTSTPAPESTTPISSSLPNGYKKMIANLEGSWKMTAYPFGGAEFKGQQVKFMEGEGSKATPQFENFTLSNQCNRRVRAPHLDLPEAYLLRANNGFCNKIKLVGDTLSLGTIGPNYSIIYTRVK